MDDFRLHPERRVFHLDTECYIVYLGNDEDDYKPFLRVGNTGHLDKELRQLTHPIVVTDTYTGSPLLESRNLSDILGDDFRYVGDPDTVERFKRFLRHMEFPSAGFESGGSEEMEERGCFVYFYDDGNIRIKYHKTQIFDLKRREERDLHYTERAKRIKNMLSRSQVRVPQKEFEAPGFFVRGGAAYLFSRRAIGALSVRDEYFAELAQAGLDPDRIRAIAADQVTEGLIRLFKRTRGKTEPLRILTSDPDGVDPAVDLFRGKERLGLRAEAARLHSDRFVSFLDFRVQKRAGGYLVEHADFGVRMLVPSSDKPKEEGMAALDPENNVLRYRSAGTTREIPLLEGVPHRLVALPGATGAASTYLPRTLNEVSDLVGEGEVAVIQRLISFFQEFEQGADTDETTRAIRSSAKALSGEVTGVFWVYASNAFNLARLYASEVGDNKRRRRALEAVQESVRGELATLPAMAGYPSAVADLAFGPDGVYPLYRFTAQLTPDKVEFSGELIREIAATVTDRDEDHFARESERLQELLSSLDTSKARVPRSVRRQREREQAAREQEAQAKQEAEADQAQEAQEAAENQDQARKEVAAAKNTESAAASKSQQEQARRREAAERRAVSTDTSALGAAAGAAESGGGPRRERGSSTGRRIALLAAALLVLLGGSAIVLYVATDIPGQLGLPPIAGLQQNVAPATEAGNAEAEASSGESPGDEAAETGGEAAGETDQSGDGSGDGEDGDPMANRPGTPQEQALAQAYSDGNGPPGLESRDTIGGLTITILDIIRLANRIAVANGYQSLGGEPEDRPDPDWIYPGNEFEMPDGSTETVVSGDTLWYIAAEYLDRMLRERYRRYEALMAEYDPDAATTEERNALISELESLSEATNSEQFAALLQDQIEAVRGGGALEQERSE